MFFSSFLLAGAAGYGLMQHMGMFELTTVPVQMVSADADEADGSAVGKTVPSHQARIVEQLKSRLEVALVRLRGKRIWEVDIGEVRASISKDEWVKDVLISRGFPNSLRILVRPKSAAVILVGKQGEFRPVTEDGEILKPLEAGLAPDVPLLRGEVFASEKEPKRRMDVVKFVSGLSDRGPMSAQNISEIGWSADDGYTLVLIQPKVEIKLGEDRLDLKAMRVAQVMNYLSTNSLKGRVIDASFSKKVLVRLRKGP